ncbi:MAG TPA: hypothetical protein ENJ37_03030 [Deltaproteobacteria bacterium]|nr:hypothetical protein [Deltaproteobacteria bacterium]
MPFEHTEELEAVKTAALIENNGMAFYSLLKERIDDPRISEVFSALASEEKGHLANIESSYYPRAGLGDAVTDEELDMEEYVKKASPDIFTRRISMERLVETIDNPRQAVIIALDAERYAAEYFTSMAEKSGSEAARSIWLDLAEEERGHARRLKALLDALAESV